MSDTDPSVLSGQAAVDAAPPGWSVLVRRLAARLDTGDFRTGMELLAAIGEAAEQANHHPDLTLTYPALDVRLTSHDVGGITSRDIDLAAEISRLAADRGIAIAPAAAVEAELALDTADAEATGRFWAAALTGDPGALDVTSYGPQVEDPTGQVPTLWFQRTERHDEPRQRFHVDLWIDPSILDDRIAAAVGAGGTVVKDDERPSFVVLADPEGNKICFCTALDR